MVILQDSPPPLFHPKFVLDNLQWLEKKTRSRVRWETKINIKQKVSIKIYIICIADTTQRLVSYVYIFSRIIVINYYHVLGWC